jgi:hypothetical protein
MEYYFSPDYRVEVIFGENIIDHVKTEIKNGELRISNDAKCNWVRDLSKHPLIRVYAPSFNRLENRCSGDITFKDTLKSEQFHYDQWECNGVAILLLENALTAISMHVGYCDVFANGTTNQAELYTAAAGRLRASRLISPVTLTNNSSFQNMEVYAEDYLYAEINESGNTKYAGEPEEIDSVISGSGNLQEL